MLTRVAADGVLIVHLLFILFAALGASLVIWRWKWLFVHIPALAWAVWIETTHGICPLTPLENVLRRAAGEAGYSGSFVQHYLVPLIYPPGLTAAHQDWIALGLIVLNLILYSAAFMRHRRRQQSF